MFVAGGGAQHMHRALRRALQQQQRRQQQHRSGATNGNGGNGATGNSGGATGGGPHHHHHIHNPSFRAPSPGGFAHAAAASSTALSAAAAGGPAAALAALLARGGTVAAGAAAAAGARFAAAALLGGTTAAVALNSRADRRDVSMAAAAQQHGGSGGGGSGAFAAPSSSSGESSNGNGSSVAAGAWGGGQKRGNASSTPSSSTTARESDALPWVRALAESEGVREVPLPGQMLRDHPIGRLVSEPDHLLANMVSSGQMREFRCFYDEKQRLFHSVVLVGRDVAGYPSTLHGGATAAFVDETLGGLYTSLLAGGKLGATLPGLTKRLEVDYKRTAPTGGALLITAEVESVEPRKVWMRASVRDGATGAEYATGRALFVAPHLGRMILRALGLPGPGGRAGASELGNVGVGGVASSVGGSNKPVASRPPSSPIGGKGRSEPPEEGGW